MNRIDFKLPDVGLREIHGMIWFEDGFVVLKVENKVLGMFDGESKIIKIEPSAISDIYVLRLLFRTRLVLVPKKRDLLDAVPGKHTNELRLKVSRKDMRQLDGLILEVKAWTLSIQAQSSTLPDGAP